jgi:phage terminase large subunit GpA-like protein
VLRRGRRNEALDSEIYALHAARSRKTHLMREEHWQAIEAALRQAPLFEAAAVAAAGDNEEQLKEQEVAAEAPEPTPPSPPPRLLPPRRNFVMGWRRRA